MDYEVITSELKEHGRGAYQHAGAAGAVLGQVRLDTATSALAGGLAARVSGALQGRFATAASSLRDGLDDYARGIADTARNYAEQEERAADAISSFFGR